MGTIYSHSRLSAYENCPRRFAFKYIEKPDIVERTSIEAYMGKAVHDTLEKLYEQVQMERTPKWNDILDHYEQYWARHWTDDIFIVRSREYTAQDYKNVGRRCLQDYFTRHFPFAESRVIGLEMRVLIDLDGTGDYRLQGFIDRLSEAEDGSIEIHDYKTSRRLPSQDEADRERQLALYQIGIKDRWPDGRSVRLIWHYLRHNRALVSKRSPEALGELKSRTCRLIDEVEFAQKVDDFPPRESALCDWCDFQSLCPAKRHQFQTADMTPEQFELDDGVRLADQFVEAAKQKTLAEQNWEDARQMLIRFSEQHKLTNLVGHTAAVRISRRKEESIPDKKSPDRAELESLVQQSGNWQEVSDLSRFKLPKALKNGLFDPQLRQRIAALLKTQERTTVTKRLLATDDTNDGPDI